MIFDDQLVLFSIGLGAVPTLSFASGLDSQSIKGAILLSPILESKTNNQLEQNVNCPVFFIHGKANIITSYELTAEFANSFKSITEWYPTKGSYSNITIRYRDMFYSKLKDFLSFIQIIHPKQHYSTNPLSKMNFNSNDNSHTTEEKDKISSKTKLHNQMNTGLNYYSSGVLSSNIDSLVINDNNQYKNNISSLDKWSNYFSNSSMNSEIDKHPPILNENENQLTVHRKESNLILNTIRGFNVK